MSRNLILTIITFFIASAFSFTPAQGAEERLQASLITCYPGPEVYELAGHEAIRIHGIDSRGIPVDSVWNYGVFDFTAPNFIWRFVKGETDYMVWGYPFAYFLPEYEKRGSKVVEQNLNFTPQEIKVLRALLQLNALPQNRFYRYNYVRDNCSTRIVDIIDASVEPRRIVYPDSTDFGSFRGAMRYYHKNYPWYQFGIDLALGGGIDLPISAREELFAPLIFEQKAANAHFDDGAPLISSTTVLYDGRDCILPPTPWYLTPMAASLLVMAVSLCISFYQWKRGRIIKWWNTLFFSLLGLGGCVVWFLVFCSSHDSTSPNLLSLWLNPLQFVMAICIWWRHTRAAALGMSVVNLIVLVTLTAVWPLQVQSANPAVFPLWAATFALSLAYAVVHYKSNKH